MSVALVAADVVAVVVLVAVYLTRSGRRDLVAALVAVNVGVLAVAFALATALASSAVATGVGLGLFGVLSIIRLRSEELTQRDIAYYFAALALGLLGGLGGSAPALIGSLMALILLALYAGDHPAISRPSSRQLVVLDRAHESLDAARRHAEHLFGPSVTAVSLVKTDFVNDTTTVLVHQHLDDRPRADREVAAMPAFEVIS